MWDSNPRVPDPQTGVLTKLHQYRQNIQLSRDSRNRTHTDGFGDRSSTFKIYPYHAMEGSGFEPPNPKERIYSPPRLASSLPFRYNKNYFNIVFVSMQVVFTSF